MARRRPPRSVATSVVILAAVLAGLVSCGRNTLVGRAPVASVGDVDISRADLDEAVAIDRRMATYSAEEPAAAVLAPSAALFAQVEGETLPTSGVAASLTTIVQEQLIARALDDAGGKVTKANRTAAREQFSTQLQQGGLDLAKLPKAYVDQQVKLRALQAALLAATPVDDDALKDAYDQQKDQFANVCVSIIATADEAEAQEAFDRLGAGEEFKAVSDDVNTDETLKGSGGEAGCAMASQIAQSLGPSALTAPVGEPLPPTPVQDQFLVVEVTKRDVPKLAAIRDQLSATLAPTGAQDALARVLKRTKVTIDPRYGTWDRTRATVIPPDAGVSTTTDPVSTDTGGTSTETVPTETVPTETVPTETVPTETVPTETVPTQTVPGDTVPTQTVAPPPGS